jgi:hypothetical protein
MPHRYQYSLDLLAQVIAKAPRFFPSGKKQDMQDTLTRLAEQSQTTREEIDAAIVSFGREIWPYRKAFWHIHDTDGRHDEDAYLRDALAPELREKYEQFLKKGFRIEDVRAGGEFERFFTQEERQAFIAAKLSAHDRVVNGIEDLCVGEHKTTCEDALGRYIKEQKEIDALVKEFRGYADKSEKWRNEILDKVNTFAAGWSGLEREVSVDAVRGEIDYYSGIIEIFE